MAIDYLVQVWDLTKQINVFKCNEVVNVLPFHEFSQNLQIMCRIQCKPDIIGIVGPEENPCNIQIPFISDIHGKYGNN